MSRCDPQKVVYIPFSSPGKSIAQTNCKELNHIATTDDDDQQSSLLPPYNPFQERDMPGGLELRMEAYRKAWDKCLERTRVGYTSCELFLRSQVSSLQAIIHSIQTPVVDAIVKEIRTTYSNVLPGLPYPELSVISLTSEDVQRVGSTLVTDLSIQLRLWAHLWLMGSFAD